MTRKLIIFGDRTAEEVLETARLAYRDQFVQIRKHYFEPNDFKENLVPAETGSDVFFHVGMANMDLKASIVRACQALNWKPFTVVHPAAVIAPSAEIGIGCYLAPLAVVSSHVKIGAHCIVHIHSSLGHDSIIGKNCAVLPGARISGNVELGEDTIVGSNAFVAAGVRIGRECQVDALTYVNSDLPARHIASIRTRKPVRRVTTSSHA